MVWVNCWMKTFSSTVAVCINCWNSVHWQVGKWVIDSCASEKILTSHLSVLLTKLKLTGCAARRPYGGLVIFSAASSIQSFAVVLFSWHWKVIEVFKGLVQPFKWPTIDEYSYVKPLAPRKEKIEFYKSLTLERPGGGQMDPPIGFSDLKIWNFQAIKLKLSVPVVW